jgi:hypothetical protein
MNFGDRPGEWLGYAPGESPNRLGGGPNSPKKKTMNWRVARDMQVSKEEEQQQQKDGDSSAIKGATEVEKPTPSLPPPAPVELDSSVGSDEEEIIEELVVDEDGPVFDVVEYEDDNDDDGSEYEEEVLEDSDESSNQGGGAGEQEGGGSDRTDEDSMFDPLPPPIVIPNALKPVHMRQSEPKSGVLASKQEDSSSDDDSTDSDDEKEQKQTVNSLRPGTLRGHSNDGLENMGSQVRRGKRTDSSDKKTNEAVEDIKEAPRVAPTAVRPSVVRGHSCEDDIQAMNEAVQASRGGKRPEKPSDNKEDEPVPSPSKMEATSPPVSPLRPGTVRGHSFDREIEDMSKAARGGKKPEKSTNDPENPSTPTQGSKPGYHSLRKEAPISSSATPTRPKTPTKIAAPTTPKSPSRRGEDTAPPVPSYTRVDDKGVEHKEYTWEKPAWATRSPLKTTTKGDKLKQGSDLARPIGGIKPVP